MPQRDASNEYHNIRFCGEIIKSINTFGLKKSALTSAMDFPVYTVIKNPFPVMLVIQISKGEHAISKLLPKNCNC